MLPSFVRIKVKNAANEKSDVQLLLLCAWWALTTIGFFSISATKLVHYILPAFPALSVIVGSYIANNSSLKGNLKILEKIADALLILIGIVLGLFFLFGLPRVLEANKYHLVAPGESIELGWGPTAIGLLLIGVCILYFFLVIFKKRPMAFFSLAVSMVAINLIFIFAVFPMAAKYYSEPPRDLSRLAAEHAGRNGIIISYDWKTSSNLVYYSKSKVDFVKKDEILALNDKLRQPGKIAVLTRWQHIDNPIFKDFKLKERKGAFALLVK